MQEEGNISGILWKSGVIQPNREKICEFQLECYEVPSYLRVYIYNYYKIDKIR